MKVLYIDILCADNINLYYYSTGLAGAMAKYAKVTLAARFRFTPPAGARYRTYRLFYPHTEDLKPGLARRALRGFEYVDAYMRIEKLCKKEHFDVIHIEWPWTYKFDIWELKRLKKLCRLLVMKTHTIVPHSSGDQYVEIFRQMYSVPDIILVHGENIKKKFVQLFPEYEDKVRIQLHGTYANYDCSYSLNSIPEDIRSRIAQYDRMYLFCGRIDYDKGVDRLVNAWKKYLKDSRSLLVIAGKVENGYNFDEMREEIKKYDNILFIEGFVEKPMVNYLTSTASVVLLPYREGAVSGVAFTAANFAKPVLATEFGDNGEYFADGENSFIVPNDEEELGKALLDVDAGYSNEDLEKMGEAFRDFCETKFSWDKIARELVRDVYKAELEKHSRFPRR